jgi:hypothetical protein
LTLSVAVYPPLFTVVGEIDAFRSDEEGETNRSTGEEKPLVGLIVIVDVCDPPLENETGAGLAEREKLGPTTVMEM